MLAVDKVGVKDIENVRTITNFAELTLAKLFVYPPARKLSLLPREVAGALNPAKVLGHQSGLVGVSVG